MKRRSISIKGLTHARLKEPDAPEVVEPARTLPLPKHEAAAVADQHFTF